MHSLASAHTMKHNSCQHCRQTSNCEVTTAEKWTKYKKRNITSIWAHIMSTIIHIFALFYSEAHSPCHPCQKPHGSGLPCRHLWTCCFLTELSKEQCQISPDPWCCTSFLIFGHVLRWQQRTQQLWQIKHPWRQGLLSQKLPSMWPTWLQYGYDMATASWGSSDINQET